MTPALERDDIQSSLLRSRPAPFAGAYLFLRFDECRSGRAALGRLAPAVASAADPASPAGDAWFSAALTFRGLEVLGVPPAALATFAPEFQQGMAARAEELGDVGECAPAAWDAPFCSPDLHAAVFALAPDAERLDAVVERTRAQCFGAGVEVLHRQDVYKGAEEREPFGFRDGISQPPIEGSGIPGSNPAEPPLKAGEFVLGYPDETGAPPQAPGPTILGRNGSYVVIRKLHQRVAAFRQHLHALSPDRDQQELFAAKMMGRWRSGAPLVLCPERDDPELGADARRNNDFRYVQAGDARGFRCPPGSHARRMNPRDGLEFGDVRLHRMIRRGTTYGPPLPDGVLEDDGADRGIIFLFLGAHLRRQFEFVQTQWVNSGLFIGATAESDPIAGAGGLFTIPKEPVRQRLRGLPRFTVLRGGAYCFLPGLRALRWLADPDR